MNADLAEFPARVRAAAEAVPADKQHTRPSGGGWSIVEQLYHLSDLEREAWSVRIQRLLGEDNPQLPNFDGDAIAAARNYNEQALEPAIIRLVVARAVNVRRLDEAPDLNRTGQLEGAGPVTLSGIADLMRQHDAEHLAQITDLLRDLGVAVPPTVS